MRDALPNTSEPSSAGLTTGRGDAAGFDADALDRRVAARLRALRTARGWSLEALAQRSRVSRAALSRLENAEVSATAATLGRLCAAYGLSVSRLMQEAEAAHAPLVPRCAQEVWTDAASGFARRSVSPPAADLAGEAVEGTLQPGARIAYAEPPRPGLEHHLVLLEGRLTVALDEAEHALEPGDCLRYRLHGASRFETPPDAGARYLLFVV